MNLSLMTMSWIMQRSKTDHPSAQARTPKVKSIILVMLRASVTPQQFQE